MEEGKCHLQKHEGRRKGEVMIQGHGLRERYQGLMHTQHEEYNPHDEHDEM